MRVLGSLPVYLAVGSHIRGASVFRRCTTKNGLEWKRASSFVCSSSSALLASRPKSGVAPTSSYLDQLSSTTSTKDGTVPSDSQLRERRIKLLDEALGFNTTASSELLTEWSELRSSGSQEATEQLLNDLLSVTDGVIKDDKAEKSKELVVKQPSFPWWTKIRPLARFSRRARRLSLRRVLDLTTPAVEEGDSSGDDDLEARLRRRKRSLLILLRTLATPEKGENDEPEKRIRKIPAIRELEKIARRDAKLVATSEDMEKRLPPGLETPRYTVLARRPKDGYEVRRYDAFSVCSVPMNKPRPTDASRTDATVSNPQLSGASAFGALAGYLFGKNDQSKAMKMTTPVLSVGEGDDRQMSFVLPSEFWHEKGMDGVPKPLDGSRVELQRDVGGDRAVVMFGGFASKREVEARTSQLLKGIGKDDKWMAVEGAQVTLAQYNDPFTPPWRRRNEVSIPVVPRIKKK